VPAANAGAHSPLAPRAFRSTRNVTGSPDFSVVADARHIVHRIDGLMVDGSQHIARQQPNVFGEGVGFHRIDPDPGLFLEAQGLAPLVGEVLKPHAQAHRGTFRLARFLPVPRAELLREELGQVANHYAEVLAFAVA